MNYSTAKTSTKGRLWLLGAAKIFDLAGQTRHVQVNTKPPMAADYDAIASDWVMVGNDIRAAIRGSISSENHDRIQ